ncbi:MAG: hypothetical protein RLZ80_678 [Actinomycetota bacterium]|jgi:hypothetical protein
MITGNFQILEYAHKQAKNIVNKGAIRVSINPSIRVTKGTEYFSGYLHIDLIDENTGEELNDMFSWENAQELLNKINELAG